MSQGSDKTGADPALRVLIVEDHEDTLLMLGKLLARMPVEVIPAPDCAVARQAARDRGRVDVAVADHDLPDGNGASLLADLKQACGCTTVIVSGHGRPDTGLPAGVDHWMPKPLDLPALTRMINGVARR
jgi:DNA-binding response OmpR family regulator